MQELFNRMIEEDHKRGTYAVEMLITAEQLLEQIKLAPRQTNAAAYCIRQALQVFFADEEDIAAKRSKTSEQVVKYARQLEIDASTQENKRLLRNRRIPQDERSQVVLPYNNLQRLFNSVNKLDKIRQEASIHKQIISSNIQSKTGLNPQVWNFTLPDKYDKLISDLNRLAHKPQAQNDVNAVRQFYDLAIFLFTMILFPDRRIMKIAELAALDDPKKTDADLLQTILGPHDFDFFVKEIRSDTWFRLIDQDMLKPSAHFPWLVRSIAHYLKNEHTDAFLSFLHQNWSEWMNDSETIDVLGFTAFSLGERGLPFLAKLLIKQPQSGLIRDLARRTCLQADATTSEFYEVSEILLNRDREPAQMTDEISTKLVAGMAASSSLKRCRLLSYKLQKLLNEGAVCYIPRRNSLTDMKCNKSSVAIVLLCHLRDALVRAQSMNKPLSDLVEVIAKLPYDVRTRFEAWLYSNSDAADCLIFVDYVMAACHNRDPTGDDINLLNRLKRDCKAEIKRITATLGKPPSSKIQEGLKQNSIGIEEKRRSLWAIEIGGADLPKWVEFANNLERHIPSRSSTRKGHVESEDPTYVSVDPQGPFSKESFDCTNPHVMAGQIGELIPFVENKPDSLSSYAICSALKDAIVRDPDKWAANPTELIKLLRYPTYVACYFRGLSNVDRPLDSYSNQLILAIQLARTHNLSDTSPDSISFTYNFIWQEVDNVGIDLMGNIARNSQLSEESLSVAWEHVLKIVRELPTRTSDKANPETEEDYMTSAINRPRTNAIQVLLYLIHNAMHWKHGVPRKVLGVLTEVLQLAGRDGAEHRAILASHIGLLRSSVPDWLKENEPLFFGDEAPQNLAQLSLDIHIEWENPDRGVLEKHRSGVLDAAQKNINNAIDCLMIGMYWRIDGYDPKALIESLRRMGSKYVSRAGECAAHLLKDEKDSKYIPLGIDLWKNALALTPTPEALTGYGMWANVPALDQDQWEELTLETCILTKGKLDWAGDVAKRIDVTGTITNTGLTILKSITESVQTPLDKALVAEHTLNALRRSKGNEQTQKSWNRLREAMINKGLYHKDDID